MTTKIGIIAEGPIDHALLPPLLERIAQQRAQFQWPLDPADIAEIFPIRKRGHGGVLETVQKLVRALDTEFFDHAFFVILLDRKTRPVQAKIKKLLHNRNRFVLATAIEEIEAWWLGDRHNTLAWSRLAHSLPPACRYARSNYQAEKDDQPKKTLDELTRLSNCFDRCYGQGNLDMAIEFAENYWRRHARLEQIRQQCPIGFGAFETEVTQQFRAAKRRAGRLF